jgi:hypothetical protein
LGLAGLATLPFTAALGVAAALLADFAGAAFFFRGGADVWAFFFSGMVLDSP